MDNKLKCHKHPKYRGDKKPKYQCDQCLTIYATLNRHKHRAPIIPTKVIPDKTKYSRKQKHKKKLD